MFKQLGLGLLGLVLLPSVAIAQVQPQPIKIDPVYLGKDGDGKGVMLIKPVYTDDRQFIVSQYLYGKGALKVRNRLAWFDCEKGAIVKIQQVYFGKTIEVNAPPKSEPFRLMMGIACANRHDDIEG